MKYDYLFPDAPDGFQSSHNFALIEKFANTWEPCFMCKTHTCWIELDFQAFLCSEECYDRLWGGFVSHTTFLEEWMLIRDQLCEGGTAVVVMRDRAEAEEKYRHLLSHLNFVAKYNDDFENLTATFSNNAVLIMALVDKPITVKGALYWAFVPFAALKDWNAEFLNRTA